MLLYWPGYLVFAPIAKLVHHLRVEGRANIPRKGPLVVVSNHISRRDPAAINIAMRRPVHFMAKKEVFSLKTSGLLEYLMVNLFGAFPVDRDHPGPEAIRAAEEIIMKGACVGIFPETTRFQDELLHPFAGGAAYFARKLKVPLLPIGVTEAFHEDYRVKIGKPFELPDIPGRPRDVLPQLTGIIREKIMELLPGWSFSEDAGDEPARVESQ
ncbi:MAG: lysophospholipid acyltransferase family protein [Candidatus Geothermincolia bacterium]